MTWVLDVFTIQWRFALPVVPIAMAVYYLAWKYLVGFLNDEFRELEAEVCDKARKPPSLVGIPILRYVLARHPLARLSRFRR